VLLRLLKYLKYNLNVKSNKLLNIYPLKHKKKVTKILEITNFR